MCIYVLYSLHPVNSRKINFPISDMSEVILRLINGFFCNPNAWRNERQKSRCGLYSGAPYKQDFTVNSHDAPGHGHVAAVEGRHFLFAAAVGSVSVDQLHGRGLRRDGLHRHQPTHVGRVR